MQKVLGWLLWFGVSLACLASSAWYYLGYGLFTPHSNIVYTGLAYVSWKFFLASALFSLVTLFLHGYLSGKALWHNQIIHAAKISGLTVLSLITLFLIQKFM